MLQCGIACLQLYKPMFNRQAVTSSNRNSISAFERALTYEMETGMISNIYVDFYAIDRGKEITTEFHIERILYNIWIYCILLL